MCQTASPYPASCTPKLPGHQPPRRSLSPPRHIVAKSPKPDCRSNLFTREIASRSWPKISPKCSARKSRPKIFLYLNHTHKCSVPHFRSHIRSFGFAFSVPFSVPHEKVQVESMSNTSLKNTRRNPSIRHEVIKTLNDFDMLNVCGVGPMLGH